MKKFSVLMAFVFAVMISSTALAADWTQIEVGAGDDIKVFVDKSSIKREIHSELCGVHREEGFSANVKLEFLMSGQDSFKMINLIGFFEDNGVKKMIYLDKLDENGNILPDAKHKPEEQNADGSDGEIWPKVFDYIQSNLP